MAGVNRDPLFSGVAMAQWSVDVTIADDNQNLTAANLYTVFTADATNGSYVKELRVLIVPNSSSNPGVLRVWINKHPLHGARHTYIYPCLAQP